MPFSATKRDLVTGNEKLKRELLAETTNLLIRFCICLKGLKHADLLFDP